MPVLHLVILLSVLAVLAVFGGIPWLYVAVAYGLCLLLIIALYRRV